MKALTVIFLLLLTLFVGVMPYYSQNNTTLNPTEKQFEELSLSESFTNTIGKQVINLNSKEPFDNPIFKFKCVNKNIINFKITKIFYKPCKYGLHVWLCWFIN